MKYLKFLDDVEAYLAHVGTRPVDESQYGPARLALVRQQRGGGPVTAVTFVAIATAPYDRYIARLEVVLLRTDDLQLRHAASEQREAVHARFDELKSKFEAAGVGAAPGIWAYDPGDRSEI